MAKRRKHGEVPTYAELNKRIRKDWGDVNPVSRKVESKKNKPTKHKKKQFEKDLRGEDDDE